MAHIKEYFRDTVLFEVYKFLLKIYSEVLRNHNKSNKFNKKGYPMDLEQRE